MVAEQGSIRNPVNLQVFKGENFQGWMPRFKSMMFIIDSQYEALFEHFENTDKFNRPITDEDFKKSDGSIHEQNFKLSKPLKSYVINYCDYSLDVVLNAESTTHGFELWRRLRDRYDHRSKVMATSRLARAMNMKFDTKNLESNLVDFEHEISRYEMESGSKVDEGVKIATLINGTSGPLFEWIRLRAPDNDWQAI